MPYIPHTANEIQDMLATIGVDSIENLFDEIPAHLRCKELEKIPAAMTEMELTQVMQSRAAQDGRPVCFIGAGAYDHYVPAAVWQITTRGEYYTAYTPYQAEASQGTLQLIYEFQSMMTALTAMDVSNASLYDGASALAEALLMAVRANRKSKSRKVLMPKTVPPLYRKVCESIVRHQNLDIVELDYNPATGITPVSALEAFSGDDITAVVIPSPNFFGALEDVDGMTDWAAAQGAISIALVNPLSLALLKPPGEWGAAGVDIACGEGQPLGAPMSSGGPYYGFMCCRKAHIRQMPGRIVGRTLDTEGREGFVLTLQAREQHIRRSKATSNICTNQGLVVTASTIHMAMMGPKGLEQVATRSHHNTAALVQKLSQIEGVEIAFSSPFFHEAVLKLSAPANEVLAQLADANILGGYDLSVDYPELGNALLVCATEMRTEAEMENYVRTLANILQN